MLGFDAAGSGEAGAAAWTFAVDGAAKALPEATLWEEGGI
jgi:hypothetical protein